MVGLLISFSERIECQHIAVAMQVVAEMAGQFMLKITGCFRPVQ
jgi:hypothetical protein